MYWLNRHLRDEAPHDVGSAAQALIDSYTRDPTRRRHPDVGDVRAPPTERQTAP